MIYSVIQLILGIVIAGMVLNLMAIMLTGISKAFRK